MSALQENGDEIIVYHNVIISGFTNYLVLSR